MPGKKVQSHQNRLLLSIEAPEERHSLLRVSGQGKQPSLAFVAVRDRSSGGAPFDTARQRTGKATVRYCASAQRMESNRLWRLLRCAIEAPEERHSLAQRVSAGRAWPMKTSPGGAALNRIRI